ncbi:MAG: hypothetical protein F6K35_37980, partial [Okeania sp. SIO2H7]|nr:hypothetical protein [Okeania sp. SIO2H7]
MSKSKSIRSAIPSRSEYNYDRQKPSPKRPTTINSLGDFHRIYRWDNLVVAAVG